MSKIKGSFKKKYPDNLNDHFKDMKGRHCVLCDKKIEIMELTGRGGPRPWKLRGTTVKVLKENKNYLLDVCDNCQKKENYVEEVKSKWIKKM